VTQSTARNLFCSLVMVLTLTGCGAVEQHEQDKAQEARLAAMEARLDKMGDLVTVLADALARARVAIAAAIRAMGGGR